MLVHCSAGVGRTGCFLALSIGIKQLDLENLVDVVKIVCNLRIERWINRFYWNKIEVANKSIKQS